MFKILRSTDDNFSPASRNSVLSFLEKSSHFTLPAEVRHKAIFILPERIGEMFSGGAVLYPQQVSKTVDLYPEDALDATVQKIFSSFHPTKDFYWVARIFFSLDEEDFEFHHEVSDCVTLFYDSLYDAFVQFSSEEDVDFLPFVLPLSHTYKTHAYRAWPFLFEFQPKESCNEIFYGILSLIEHNNKVISKASVIPFPRKKRPALRRVSSDLEVAE